MGRYLLLRLADAVPTILLVLTLVFIAMRILPGDPAIAALGDMATPEQLQIFREKMGLNAPLWLQYINFVWGVLTLDFGTSFMNNQSVLRLIGYNLPYTIELTVVAMFLGVGVGIPLGVLAATHRNKSADSAVRGFSLLGYAVPDFYLGALLLITSR
ncbi:ABC transporter permease [Rhizobium sp. XQZ8]|uniref:ABC transporter permease n=1 Tax=Rhizobium populisoli TaxID=2859785 RepID=UPI001CA48429|nr:ABC transporter permease [Rhizobium populisoli]MBW6425802.1 ABC transporter permease [Rhizobium populisoli]